MDENKQEQMVSIIVPVYNAEAYLPEIDVYKRQADK